MRQFPKNYLSFQKVKRQAFLHFLVLESFLSPYHPGSLCLSASRPSKMPVSLSLKRYVSLFVFKYSDAKLWHKLFACRNIWWNWISWNLSLREWTSKISALISSLSLKFYLLLFITVFASLSTMTNRSPMLTATLTASRHARLSAVNRDPTSLWRTYFVATTSPLEFWSAIPAPDLPVSLKTRHQSLFSKMGLMGESISNQISHWWVMILLNCLTLLCIYAHYLLCHIPWSVYHHA